MLKLLLSVLAEDLLPIFVVAGAGFLLARRLQVEVRPLARVTFHVLAPCLVFQVLVTSTLHPGDFGRMVVFAAAVRLAVGAIARIVTLPLRLEPPALSALLIVVMFSNTGNYGLSVVLFAFGREALSHASIYFAAGAVLMYTLGVFIASSGRRSPGQALLGVFRVPVLYAVALAALVMVTGTPLPTGLMRPVSLLADAAIPVMLLVLGMQLERGGWPERPALVGLAAGFVLVVSPLVGFGLADAMGLEGAARQAAITQASMPAAVVNTILALEYRVEPAFVTAAVLVSTLLSPITVAVVIALLHSGF